MNRTQCEVTKSFNTPRGEDHEGSEFAERQVQKGWEGSMIRTRKKKEESKSNKACSEMMRLAEKRDKENEATHALVKKPSKELKRTSKKDSRDSLPKQDPRKIRKAKGDESEAGEDEAKKHSKKKKAEERTSEIGETSKLFWNSNKPLVVRAELKEKKVKVGHSLDVEVEVKNSSKKKVSHLQVRLLQTVLTFEYEGWETKKVTAIKTTQFYGEKFVPDGFPLFVRLNNKPHSSTGRTSGKLSGPIVDEGGNTEEGEWFGTFSLQIPEDLLATVAEGETMNSEISYELVIEAHVRRHAPARVTLPVIVRRVESLIYGSDGNVKVATV